MNNNIEEIAGLFDEFFIIDKPEDTPIARQPVTKEQVSETAPTPEVVEKIQPEVPSETVPSAPEPAPQSLPPLVFSGANKKHIAVIYNDKNNDSRENVEMLSNLITKALRFSMDDVAVVRLSKNENYSVPAIIKETAALFAIVWGDESMKSEFGIHKEATFGETRVLIADDVYRYHGKNEYKAQLWEALRVLFNLG